MSMSWFDLQRLSPLASMKRLMRVSLLTAAVLSPHVFAESAAPATRFDYTVPQVNLVRSDGATVSLPKELDDGRPVILNFVYTSCSGVCPVTSQIFSQLQDKLGAARSTVHMVSISIDPEEDTPARLSDYAKKYKAGPQWQYYTGSAEASLAVQRAFDVYRGDKMAHDVATFMRAAPGKPWLRLNGFVSADDILGEFRNLVNVR